ncbi:hypothetical protein INT43_006762 [Umbelopsis isabellina]|uniref:GPI-anchored wall transfer protein n=1 Tax=Mortierella isabellina TaxID=91625 RepID=A0A8H7Q321_MORIS|nr:hypothetical protein INT43_006762 [Umbelopsis isabellina]
MPYLPSLQCSYLLWTCLRQKYNVESHAAQFVVLILPVLACQTVLADHVQSVNIALLTACTALYLTTKTQAAKVEDSRNGSTSKFMNFLSVYRATMMIMTCIAILAVDFPIFPRRFAKVETFGTSLMDIGVGSFVFSSGVVSGRAYANPSQQQKNFFITSFLSSLRSSFALLTLGFIRLISTKTVNYQEHNSEYGLHWNFFFTLGFLPPFTAIAASLSQWIPFSVLALSTAIGYQTILAHGLQEWILNAPRTDLLSANKEGICSFLGYFSIFLFGLDAGKLIFSQKLEHTRILRLVKNHAKTKSKYGKLIIALAFWSIVYFALFTIFMSVIDGEGGQQISRRIANLPYIMWVITFNFGFILAFVIIDAEFIGNGSGTTVPKLFDAVNANGLLLFLVANLLTGIINMSIRTLYASYSVSFAVCAIYMFIVTKIGWFLLFNLKFRLKL